MVFSEGSYHSGVPQDSHVGLILLINKVLVVNLNGVFRMYISAHSGIYHVGPILFLLVTNDSDTL